MAKRYTGQSNKRPSSSPKRSKGIFSARVQYTILDDQTKPEIFKQYGEWNSMGGVLFTPFSTPAEFKDINNIKFAKPLFPNIKNYPLENEIIYIMSLPTNDIESNINSTEYYYFQPINIWNSIHHNAIPNPLGNDLTSDSQNQNYKQTEAGSVRRSSDEEEEIPLGETFKEKSNIKPLLSYEGDIIYEGRWGQSIRFGSTVNNSNIINNWSSEGENGDPITIFRNGQFEDDKDPWIPTLEDINKDLSSLYFTSYQLIPIELSSKSYDSYETPPEEATTYKKPQIILSTGRIIFNAREDDILFSSKKSINLNSQTTVNIDAKEKCIIQTKEVLLGDKKATESIILGDKFLGDFKQMLDKLTTLCGVLPSVGTITPYTPNTAVINASTQLNVIIKKMNKQINQYKSKTTKSI